MQDQETEALRAAIAALETQRATLGDRVLELALAPLRARLAALQRPAGLKHRLVTVLFADVVGSTALASGLDAEDTLGLLNTTLQRMAAVVEAHQGRVLRFTGDGVKAAFGMDEAREDDAERAVRAGLAILAAGHEQAGVALRQHGITGFAVRVGVHSGDVALGAGVEDDNTAMGAAVNIAARMEQHAPPGGLRISHDTWSLVRGLFDAQAQPPLVVKGVAAPMHTYLVHAARDRRVAQVERGLQGLATPMVGRDAELQRLLHTVAQARQTRRLQALTLVGDAGLGKSRLLRELTAVLQDCRPLTLRSQPDGQLRPWGLLRGLLALQCSVADTDSAEVARRKVVEGLSPWFVERGERQAQLIGQLAGLDFADSPTVKGLDPRTLRDQALLALRAYLRGLAAQGSSLPVLIVEDLHWADDSSLDLLQDLLAHAAELPLALVMSARPTLRVRRPDWVPPDTIVTLGPLPAAQGNELLQALLQRLGEVPPRLNELIVGRAEGNPYYMEELVRRLLDDGVIDASGARWTVHGDRLDTLRLPATLVGLLQARLDALPAGERQAARQASVIGHVFWDDALQAIDPQAPQALPALQRAAIVRSRVSSDFEGTPERQFDHHLLHQVTYDTLLKAERKLGHGAAARWLAERTQGRGAEFLAMTGEHAERAGDIDLAIDCFEQAGDEAARRYANTAALAAYRRALDLMDSSQPARCVDILVRMNRTADILGDRALQDALLAERAALLDRHPDPARQARLLLGQAHLAERRSDSAGSERLAGQAFELAARCEAADVAALSQVLLAWRRGARGDHVGAGGQVQIGLQWAARIEAGRQRMEAEVQLLGASATVSKNLRRFDEARSILNEVLARSEALGDPHGQLLALQNLSGIAGDLCLWEEAAHWAARMQALARSFGATPREAAALWLLAYATESLGSHSEAIVLYEKTLALCRTHGDRRKEALTLQRLVVSHHALGDLPIALQYGAEAHAVDQTIDEPVEAGVTVACAARCELRLGRPEVALAAVDQLLGTLSQDGDDRLDLAAIELRWHCRCVLETLGDARAAPMLEQLFADVQALAAELTDATDRERLIQASPVFRSIVEARSAAPRSA